MKKNRPNSAAGRWAAVVLLAAANASIVAGQNAPPKPMPYVLSGAYTLSGKTDKSTAKTYSSDTKDVSAIYVKSGGELTLTGPVITTTADSSSNDNSSAYGLNAAVLVTAGGRVKATGGSVTTSGAGANGAFATGSGSSILLSQVKISTTGNESNGAMATLGGKLTLDKVDITTTGQDASAIATDRGGGTITFTGGTMNTSGPKAAAIYSTGIIKIFDSTVIATGAEAAVVEGKASLILSDTNLTGQKSRGVLIYQPTASNSQQGSTATFGIKGGSLTALDGPLFYVTNTTATVYTTGSTFNATSGTLVQASAGEWGKSGFNGGNVTFTADEETIAGDMTADNFSSITAKLQNKTTLTGMVKNVSLSLDNSSIWVVTGDSTVTTLNDAKQPMANTFANIVGNGHTVIYDSTQRSNHWLRGKTYQLASGGQLIPSKPDTNNNNGNNSNGNTPNMPGQNNNNNGGNSGFGGGRGGGGGRR